MGREGGGGEGVYWAMKKLPGLFFWRTLFNRWGVRPRNLDINKPQVVPGSRHAGEMLAWSWRLCSAQPHALSCLLFFCSVFPAFAFMAPREMTHIPWVSPLQCAPRGISMCQ